MSSGTGLEKWSSFEPATRETQDIAEQVHSDYITVLHVHAAVVIGAVSVAM